MTNVPLAVLFYELFKVVSRRIALLDAAFILVATSIEAAGPLTQLQPLALLGSGSLEAARRPPSRSGDPHGYTRSLRCQ